MFLFCVESSHAKGMGHLFRAINLYRLLREKGYSSAVALLGGDAASQDWLEKAAIPYATVKNVKDAEWEVLLIARFCPKVWINDRLNTDAVHAGRIKRAGLWLATFDDTGSGATLADLHVAALANVRGESPAGKKTLIGADYLIFPPEVSQLRRVRTEKKRWIVTLGGSDTHSATISVVEWLNARAMPATIVLGPAFAHESAMSLLDSQYLIIKRSVPSLLKELADHDLAITGGGLTAFEAAVLGVPTAIVANEPWEVAHATYLQSLGCSVFAGMHDQINLDVLDKGMDFEGMSNAALNAFFPDGANRVVDSLCNLLETKD
jgi:spore coat polysaccharide biosynthesis predicted glycosyltransferase SpsG